MAKKKIGGNDKKWLIWSTGAFLVLVFLMLTVFKSEQCPDDYTQAQVDASNCIVGADIGSPFLALFVLLPLGAFVLILWLIALARWMQKRKK